MQPWKARQKKHRDLIMHLTQKEVNINMKTQLFLLSRLSIAVKRASMPVLNCAVPMPFPVNRECQGDE